MTTLKILPLIAALIIPATSYAADKPPTCPSHNHYYDDWQQSQNPYWEDLTPEQVKQCMQQYWTKAIETSNKSLSNIQEITNNAQRHLGMWQ